MSKYLEIIKKNAMLIILVLVYIFFTITTRGSMFQAMNFNALITQNAYVFILATGMLMCMLTGGNIDLSCGSFVCFIGVIGGLLMVLKEVPVPVAIIATLVVGIIYGCVLGYLIAYVNIPPWIATLAGYLAFRGWSVALLTSNSSTGSIAPFPKSFLAVFSGKILETAPNAFNVPCFVVGVIASVIVVILQLNSRAQKVKKGYEVDKFAGYLARMIIISVVVLLFAFRLAQHKGIPTVFISYTGESLDYKAPLKKALKAVNDAALPICKMFDPAVTHVQSNLGWEQEYFLVDDGLYAARPDLVACGRTLLGHASAKNQQMDDHYFGQIPTRVQAFMTDLEIHGHRLGIPMKTRHNEVAPNQFEFAPIFGETNLAVDQNMLIMGVMKKIARRHGFRVLLHEKPFEGINGSGKHNNWSLSTNTGTILLAPGKDPQSNLQFVTFFVNVLMALKRHGALLKASIASATNAHRLGANEAPPAIISAFLGKTMTEVLRKLLTVPDDTDIVIAGKHSYDLGLVEIPSIFLDNTDRNRTSPFAFTGNRFEFRAVGSKANCSGAMTTLNAAVAEQLIDFKAKVDDEMLSGATMKVAFMRALKPIIAEIIDTVCFDGNGYSAEWPVEAVKRGLDVERCVPKMFLQNVKPESIAMFEKLGVFSKAELEARNEVKFETYTKLVQIEARTLGDLAINHIIPAATSYQSQLLKNVAMMKSLFPTEWETLSSYEISLIKKIASFNAEIKSKVDDMVAKRKVANKLEDGFDKAMAYYEIAESLNDIRKPIDKLEELVDDNIWPMPKYRELLWIR